MAFHDWREELKPRIHIFMGANVSGDFRLGFYRVVITPPIGTPLAGYSARVGVSVGVYDELFARAMYLNFGGEEVVLVSADVLGVPAPMRERIEAGIRERIGVSADRVVISATHTHSGPDLVGNFRGEDPTLVEMFVRKVVGAVEAASKHVFDVEGFSAARGRCRDVVVNRRNIKEGPVDPDVNVLTFFSGDAGFSILNFTCHAVVMGHNNLYISRDYPGAFVDYFEEYAGNLAMFFNGACGNINPLTPNTDLSRVYDRSVGTFEEVEWMGDVLAHEASRVLLLSRREPVKEFAFKSRIVELELQERPPLAELEEKLKEVEERVAREKTAEALYELYKAKTAIYRVKMVGEGARSYRVRIAALRVNDAAIVFLPTELFVEIGLGVKEKSPFGLTAVAGYSNDYFGYVPIAEAYREGGYESTFPVTILKEGQAERLVEEAVKLLEKLA